MLTRLNTDELFHIENHQSEYSQKMEFEGDLTVNQIAGLYLRNTYPNDNEAELTTLKNIIVSTNSLSKMATYVGIRGTTNKILEDRFEIMMGITYRKFYKTDYDELVVTPLMELFSHFKFEKDDEFHNYKGQLNICLDRLHLKYRWLPSMVMSKGVCAKLNINGQIHIGPMCKTGIQSANKMSMELLHQYNDTQ